MATEKFSKRTAIKKAILNALIGRTDAKKTQWRRTTPPQDILNELPVVLIYPTSDTVEPFNTAPKEFNRQFIVTFEIIASGKTDDEMDETLNTIQEQIEQALLVDDSLDCTVDDFKFGSTDFEHIGDGERPIGSNRFSVTFEYRVELEELAPLPDFLTAGVEFNTNKANDDDPPDPDDRPLTEAEDTIVIPQT